MLKFEATRKQWSWLEGLAFWIADNAYCRERLSKEEYEREEFSRHDDSIRACFDQLDKLNVPFWVQNATIAWAEDWRREATEYMETGLARRNITYKGV